MTIDLAALAADLMRDEGFRLMVYDDATGEPVGPGSVVEGHPTIGYGRALDVHGITGQEAMGLLNDDIGADVAALTAALPWIVDLDEIRARVLLEMGFQMGIAGLLSFKNTLAAVQAGMYAAASLNMKDSAWYRQTPARAEKLSRMMLLGVVA